MNIPAQDLCLFHIYGMKEPDYVMLIMSMYGTMLELGEDEKGMSW